MVLAPFRTRSRSRAGRSASQEPQWSPARSGLLAHVVALTSQIKVCHRLAAAREQARTEPPVQGPSIKSGLVHGKTTVLDAILVRTGRVPQAVSSWLSFSTHLFGYPSGKDETLLDFLIFAAGKSQSVSEIVRFVGSSILRLDASEFRQCLVSIITFGRARTTE
jgi:hypothetical protein